MTNGIMFSRIVINTGFSKTQHYEFLYLKISSFIIPESDTLTCNTENGHRMAGLV